MEKCFADDGEKCIALKVKDCNGCSFYKTKAEAEQGRKWARERIKTLDPMLQKRIKEIYGQVN